MSETATREAIEAVWRIESARLISGLVRIVRDLGLAEDLAQEALVAALERWPRTGIPHNPGAWLTATAKNRAVDHLRRNRMRERKDALIEAASQPVTPDLEAAIDDDVGDDLLRLMLIACHPVLSTEARVALTLRLLGGLTTEEIARAFLVPVPTIAQRIVRAKRSLGAARVPFEVPRGQDLSDRLSSVLEVIYMSDPNPKVDAFLDRAAQWQEEMKELRDILLDCGLTEELKWGKPCYTAGGGNIAIMQPFKAHLSLMFFKGALLDDPEGILRSQGENTQSAKRIELTSPKQVSELEPTLRSYIDAAVAAEEAGVEVRKKKLSEYEFPEELTKRLREDREYRQAFEALTPGRKKSCLLHFSGAKRAETRARRVDKCRAKVMEGKGFNER